MDRRKKARLEEIIRQAHAEGGDDAVQGLTAAAVWNASETFWSTGGYTKTRFATNLKRYKDKFLSGSGEGGEGEEAFEEGGMPSRQPRTPTTPGNKAALKGTS